MEAVAAGVFSRGAGPDSDVSLQTRNVIGVPCRDVSMFFYGVGEVCPCIVPKKHKIRRTNTRTQITSLCIQSGNSGGGNGGS